MKTGHAKHAAELPTPRKIRRACSNELYRAQKRLGKYIPAEKVQLAVDLYYRKVIENLIWIHENHSNRRRLADWWDEAVSSDIAELWDVDRKKLSQAFRAAFGG